MKKIYVVDYYDYATIIPTCNSIAKLQYEFTYYDEITDLYYSIYCDNNNNLYAVIE